MVDDFQAQGRTPSPNNRAIAGPRSPQDEEAAAGLAELFGGARAAPLKPQQEVQRQKMIPAEDSTYLWNAVSEPVID